MLPDDTHWFPATPRERAIRQARTRITAAQAALARAQADLDSAKQELAAAEATLARLTGGAR